MFNFLINLQNAEGRSYPSFKIVQSELQGIRFHKRIISEGFKEHTNNYLSARFAQRQLAIGNFVFLLTLMQNLSV